MPLSLFCAVHQVPHPTSAKRNGRFPQGMLAFPKLQFGKGQHPLGKAAVPFCGSGMRYLMNCAKKRKWHDSLISKGIGRLSRNAPDSSTEESGVFLFVDRRDYFYKLDIWLRQRKLQLSTWRVWLGAGLMIWDRR